MDDPSPILYITSKSFILHFIGTGKTVTLKSIADELLKDKSKTISVTGTTGISTMPYKSYNATTIHFWSGILDGRYSTPDITTK